MLATARHQMLATMSRGFIPARLKQLRAAAYMMFIDYGELAGNQLKIRLEAACMRLGFQPFYSVDYLLWPMVSRGILRRKEHHNFANFVHRSLTGRYYCFAGTNQIYDIYEMDPLHRLASSL